MKVYKTNEIKNIAIVGNSGSGKTTLAEAMLYECGLIKRRGTIEAKNTVSDYFPVEKEYEYSVFSTILTYEWKNKLMTWIDCPGSDDFSGNISSALAVTDMAVMLVDASSGVEVGTINQFRQIEKLNKPVMFVMNRMDHDKADYENTLTNLKEHYGHKLVPVQYPTGNGEAFDGIVDVLKQKYYKWAPGATAPEVLEIPDNEKEKAAELFQALLESAAENDDTLMEKYFEQGTLTEEEMIKGIQLGLINRSVFPLFVTSAEKNMAVHRLMNFLSIAAPSPDQVAAEKNVNGDVVEPDSNAPTSLFFFKLTTCKIFPRHPQAKSFGVNVI